MHYRVSDALLIELYRIEIIEGETMTVAFQLLIELYRIEMPITMTVSHLSKFF